MAIEIITGLATTVVSTYLLPYLKEGAVKMAERITKDAGDAASEYSVSLAGKIWNKVKSVFTSDDEKGTLAQFEKRPEAAKPLVEAILKEKLQQDASLLKELQALTTAKGPTGQTGAQIIGATYAGILDMRGATVSGSGNVFAGLNIGGGAPSSSIGHPPSGQKTGPGSETTSDE